MLRQRPFRLASLRRSFAFAGFMLGVFVMRLGIAVACEPHEFAELFGDPFALIQLADADHDNDQDRAREHAPDHCRQCNCHHGITLPSSAIAAVRVGESTVAASVLVPVANTPSERHLRPPIV